LKFHEDDTEVLKHAGVNIIESDNTVIYICALAGCNKKRAARMLCCVDW